MRETVAVRLDADVAEKVEQAREKIEERVGLRRLAREQLVQHLVLLGLASLSATAAAGR